MNIQKIVDQLNYWLKIDPNAIGDWAWEMHANCNNQLANDPNMQVRQYTQEEVEKESELAGYWLSPLGLLNGLLLAQDSKEIVAAHFGEDSKLESFHAMPYDECKN